MKTCFHCDKEFDETLVQFSEFEDFTLDEDYNDIPIVRTLYNCPHCDSFTE